MSWDVSNHLGCPTKQVRCDGIACEIEGAHGGAVNEVRLLFGRERELDSRGKWLAPQELVILPEGGAGRVAVLAGWRVAVKVERRVYGEAHAVRLSRAQVRPRGPGDDSHAYPYGAWPEPTQEQCECWVTGPRG